MAQLSRPFQIALAAVVLVAGVALFAFKGGSSTTASNSGAGSSVPASNASNSSASQAPGVAGLNRAVEKAHGAVATSQQNAGQLQQKSNEASDSAPATQHAGGTSAPSVAVAKPAAAVAAPSHTAATKTKTSAATHSSAKPAKAKHGLPAKQRAVEAELKAGNVVILLFWDRKGSDDVAVHNVVAHLGRHRVVVHLSTAGQVAEYGAVTRGVQVLSTPTTLVVAPHGEAKVLTGLTDAFSLDQAISEARAQH